MENWKQIKDYNYEASTLGNIRNKKTGRILSQRVGKTTGYKLVDIQVEKKNRTFNAHRLITEAFYGEPKEGDQTDHINRDKLDNRVKNLRWVTRVENCNNKIKVNKDEIENIISWYKEGKTINEISDLVHK